MEEGDKKSLVDKMLLAIVDIKVVAAFVMGILLLLYLFFSR